VSLQQEEEEEEEQEQEQDELRYRMSSWPREDI